MPVVCDDGVPQPICEDVRGGSWRRMTDLPRSNIVRIEVQCVVCEPAAAEVVFRAVLTDSTTSEIGEASWVPDWADFPEEPPPLERLP
jgi:hypothetical protein